MTSSVVLRPLSTEDAPLLAKLSKEAFQEPYDPPWSSEFFRQCLLTNAEGHPPLFAGWLALQNSIAVGFIFLQIFDEVVDLQKIATHPDFRRQGIAKKLLEKCYETFPHHAVELEVASGNPAALALYKSQGFRQIGLHPRVYIDGGRPLDALILRREPKPPLS